jgi:uncharacterized membrane protein
MIIYGTSLVVGLLQGVLIHNLVITALVSAAVVVSMFLAMKTIRSGGSDYSIGVSKMPMSVFKSEFDDTPIDDSKSQSFAMKVVVVIAVNGLGILIGTLGTQLGF